MIVVNSETDLFGVLDSKYTIVKKIGEGGTSKVYIGYDNNDDERVLYAIKLINQEKQDSKCFHIEVEMMSKLNHPNIVRLIDYGKGLIKKNNGKSKVVNYLILEHCQYGELFNFIFFPKQGFGEEFGKLIFLNILDGLESLHKSGIVHRDLKTENLMLSKDFNIKIADFGFAAYVNGRDGKGFLHTNLGTESYAAPELLSNQPYFGICNDIFSLAVTLFIIVTGSIPFRKATKNDPFYAYIFRNDYDGYWKTRNLKQNLSNNFKSLFFNLIALDFSQRPTINEIRQHPWMQNSDSSNLNNLNMLLRQEFIKRESIIVHKKQLEILMKEEENKQIAKNYVFSKGYKSGDEICIKLQKSNRVLRTFIESGNPYVVYVNQLNSRDSLFKKLKVFFKEKNAEINKSNDKFVIKVTLPLFEFDDKDDNISNTSLKFQEISLKIEIKQYNDDKLILEFLGCSRDRLKFFNIFNEFIEYAII